MGRRWLREKKINFSNSCLQYILHNLWSIQCICTKILKRKFTDNGCSSLAYYIVRTFFKINLMSNSNEKKVILFTLNYIRLSFSRFFTQFLNTNHGISVRSDARSSGTKTRENILLSKPTHEHPTLSESQRLIYKNR